MSPKQTPVVEVNDIVAASDIARMFGVTPSTISNWRARSTSGFPEPFTAVANDRTPLWRKSQVVHWWRTKHSALVDELRNMED
jgi:hypothetical protein